MKKTIALTALALTLGFSLSSLSASDHGKCMSKDGKTEISDAHDKEACDAAGGVWKDS